MCQIIKRAVFFKLKNVPWMWGLAAEPRKKKRQRALLLGLQEALSKGIPTSLQKNTYSIVLVQ